MGANSTQPEYVTKKPNTPKADAVEDPDVKHFLNEYNDVFTGLGKHKE
jgi:hypothetical protein